MRESHVTEILALTKMNWNDTQLDGALPITIRAAGKLERSFAISVKMRICRTDTASLCDVPSRPIKERSDAAPAIGLSRTCGYTDPCRNGAALDPAHIK